MLTSLLPPLLAALTAAPPVQWVWSCQGTDPRLERLADAIEHGNIDVVRTQLDGGADVNETWRDSRNPMLCRSLLLRSVWYGQDEIFRLLLKRGADAASLPRESLQIPVRNGRVEMVRTLFALGMKPYDNDEILSAGLESRNLGMLELLLSSGIAINPSALPVYTLTDDIVRFLVPKYLSPNARTGVGTEACDIDKLFGLLRKNQDGCEGAAGPLWLHFVLTGNYAVVDFMIKNGADLRLNGEGVRSFTGMEVAAKRKDTRMMDLLRRAGAPGR